MVGYRRKLLFQSRDPMDYNNFKGKSEMFTLCNVTKNYIFFQLKNCYLCERLIFSFGHYISASVFSFNFLPLFFSRTSKNDEGFECVCKELFEGPSCGSPRNICSSGSPCGAYGVCELLVNSTAYWPSTYQCRYVQDKDVTIRIISSPETLEL